MVFLLSFYIQNSIPSEVDFAFHPCKIDKIKNQSNSGGEDIDQHPTLKIPGLVSKFVIIIIIFFCYCEVEELEVSQTK